MMPMDWFISILAIAAGALFFGGFAILNNRRLELVALVGLYPMGFGLAMGALAIALFVLQHVLIRLV